MVSVKGCTSTDHLKVHASVMCTYTTYFKREREREKKKVTQSHYRPEMPRGFQEVKVPRLRDNGPE